MPTQITDSELKQLMKQTFRIAGLDLSDERATLRCVGIDDDDGGTGQDGAGFVLHQARDRAGRGLRAEHDRGEEHDKACGHAREDTPDLNGPTKEIRLNVVR